MEKLKVKIGFKYWIILLYLTLKVNTYIGQSTSEVFVGANDDKSGIPNAHIVIELSGGTKSLVLTNNSGIAKIEGRENEVVSVQISFLGYKTHHQEVSIGKNYEIYLKPESITLNNFVVTGQYSENSPEKAIQKITIIDQKKIEKMAAVNLKDVLTNEMNIRLSQDNILGSGMSLQGVGGQNVKILIDGIPMIGRLDGNLDLSQINLNNVERIEIIEGPMSVNYGTNALAGVINIITKKNDKKKLDLVANSYYESAGQFNFDGSLTISKKKHTLSISGGRNYFDGWINGDLVFGENQRVADSSRFKSWKPKEQYFGALNYGYTLKEGVIQYTFRYFDEVISNRGYPNLPYGETAFDDYYRTNRVDNAIRVNKKFGDQHLWKFALAYNDFTRTKTTYYKDLTDLSQVLTENEGDQDTSAFSQWILRSSYGNTKDSVKVNYEVGVDLNLENAYGARIEGREKQMGDFAGYGSLEYRPFRRTVIRPGVRWAYNTIYNAPITPSVNFKQGLGKFSIRASYARGFRAPSLKELYFDFVDINHNITGNTNLGAETSNNLNVSVNYTKTVRSYLMKMEVSGFYNHISNMITLAQVEGVQYEYVNLTDYRTQGIQFNTNHSYKHFKLGFGASYIGRFNAVFSDNEEVDKFTYSPEFKSTLNYDIPKAKMYIAIFYKYTGKLPGFQLLSDDSILQTLIEDYHTADVSIGKYFLDKKIQLTVGAKNIFDVKNVNSIARSSAHSSSSGGTIVGMGRTYFLKLKFNLHYAKDSD